MPTAIQNKFHWNEEREDWERVERVQKYRGHTIVSITWHNDYLLTRPDYHRGYILISPSGKETYHGINKRGSNIKTLKQWIDYNIEHNRTQYL